MNNLKLKVGDEVYCINTTSDYNNPYYKNRNMNFYFRKDNYYIVDYIDYDYVGIKYQLNRIYFKYKGLGIFETFTPEHIEGKFEDYFITLSQLKEIQRKEKLEKTNESREGRGST